MRRQPSRIVLYDKDGVVLHDASTPERIAELNAAWRGDEFSAEKARKDDNSF